MAAYASPSRSAAAASDVPVPAPFTASVTFASLAGARKSNAA